jgi:hypothetical protein
LPRGIRFQGQRDSEYSYAADNPLVWLDPTGQAPWRYVHYCGPGADAGNQKPIDALDAACLTTTIVMLQPTPLGALRFSGHKGKRKSAQNGTVT